MAPGRHCIALARAFFGDPALVVLDEPNSNLDAAGEQALTDTLKRAKERRVSVVIVTQRPTLLTSVDKVLVLKAGRPVALGTPDQVLRRQTTRPASQQEVKAPRKRKKAEARPARPENGSAPVEGDH
jgi:ATP-binding cassette, subfamily C, bacterial